MSDRNNQKQIWADIEFIKKLEELKAKKVLVGKPVKNIGELTKEIANSMSFKELEEEILNYDPLNPKKKNNALKLNIRFDGNLR